MNIIFRRSCGWSSNHMSICSPVIGFNTITSKKFCNTYCKEASVDQVMTEQNPETDKLADTNLEDLQEIEKAIRKKRKRGKLTEEESDKVNKQILDSVKDNFRHYDYPELSCAVKDEMWEKHWENPKEYNFTRLAKDYALSVMQTKAIITSKLMEYDEVLRCGGEAPETHAIGKDIEALLAAQFGEVDASFENVMLQETLDGGRGPLDGGIDLDVNIPVHDHAINSIYRESLDETRSLGRRRFQMEEMPDDPDECVIIEPPTHDDPRDYNDTRIAFVQHSPKRNADERTVYIRDFDGSLRTASFLEHQKIMKRLNQNHRYTRHVNPLYDAGHNIIGSNYSSDRQIIKKTYRKRD